MSGWTISVIMPVYCGEAFIGTALDSILAQGAARVLEVIVVDDGSTDATGAIVRARYPGIRYHRQENRGAQHARNTGLGLAQGNAIAFCDADDRWADDKLTLQVPLLERADVVIGHTRIMDDPASLPFILPSLCCALFRRSAFDAIGQFDPDLPYSDDMDWYLRAREAGLAFAVHREVVLLHRRHAGNLTRDTAKKEHYHLRMLHKSIRRRREQGMIAMPRFSDFLASDQ